MELKVLIWGHANIQSYKLKIPEGQRAEGNQKSIVTKKPVRENVSRWKKWPTKEYLMLEYDGGREF